MNIIFLGSPVVRLPAGNVIHVVDEFDFSRLLQIDPSAFGVFMCKDPQEGHRVTRNVRVDRINNPLYCLIWGPEADHTMIATILNAGADQVEKFPVDSSLFLAQLQAIQRRGEGDPDPIATFANMTFNKNIRELVADGHKVHLTGQEADILFELVAAQGQTLSKAQILDKIYGDDHEVTEKLVDVVVCHLRRKMVKISGGLDFIMTNWGFGYYFVAEGFAPNIRQTLTGPQRFQTEPRGPVRRLGTRWPKQEAAE